MKVLLDHSLDAVRGALAAAGHEVDVLDPGRSLDDAIGEASWHHAVLVTSDLSAEHEYCRTPWLASAVCAPACTEGRIIDALRTLGRVMAAQQRGATVLVVLKPEHPPAAH